ncbi:hypothetical protein GW17_00053602 [Ensete ventricosum]|nr:hypothetical protein GW17_00053602 [Ensete ventricosum]RZS11851.1 hypothetical protein BHM03_00043227 [Ensete ventricosum]
MTSTSDASPPPVADGDSVGMFSSDRISGFGYGLGVSIGMLLLITTITLASYFCTRASSASPTSGPLPPSPRAAARRPAEQETAAAGGDVEAGIDEDTLKSYPKVRYSQAKLRRDVAGAASCCSICLSDYRDTDVLRALPECGHLFHVKCVDPWLRLRPTCPLCRTSPLPSPLPTPLADAVPLNAIASSLPWLLRLLLLLEQPTMASMVDPHLVLSAASLLLVLLLPPPVAAADVVYCSEFPVDPSVFYVDFDSLDLLSWTTPSRLRS